MPEFWTPARSSTASGVCKDGPVFGAADLERLPPEF